MGELPLQGKVAVVSGGSHGLGRAIAEHLVSLGADLAALARDESRLKSVTKRLSTDGRRVLSIPCDVSQAGQVQEAARKIVSEMGRVDILVNNAGIPAPTTFQETDLDDWHQVVGVNLSGAFYLTKALWDVLVESGAGYVVIVSGTNGRRASSSPAYSSAKFGLTGLTRAIAASGSAQNLRATVLYPGAMDTGWRAAPIGVKPRTETMDPQQVAQFVGWLVTTPQEFVMNEAVLNPIGDVWV